jgi:hypothetical protein
MPPASKFFVLYSPNGHGGKALGGIVANHSRGIETPPLPRTLLSLDPGLVPMLMGNDSDMRLTTDDPSAEWSQLPSTGRHITIVLHVSYSGTCTETSVRLPAIGDSNS